LERREADRGKELEENGFGVVPEKKGEVLAVLVLIVRSQSCLCPAGSER